MTVREIYWNLGRLAALMALLGVRLLTTHGGAGGAGVDGDTSDRGCAGAGSGCVELGAARLGNSHIPITQDRPRWTGFHGKVYIFR